MRRTGLQPLAAAAMAAIVAAGLYPAIAATSESVATPPESRTAGVVEGKGTWIELPPLTKARQECATVTLGRSVFVIGGLIADPGLQSTAGVERWSPGDEAWSTAPDLPVPLDHPAATLHQGAIWVVGGRNETVATTTSFFFDPAVGDWQAGPSLPAPRWAGALASLGGSLYYFGGLDDNEFERAETLRLEPGSTEWVEREPMPLPRDHLSAVVLGDAAYLTGGRLGNESRDLHERYDPLADKWTPLAPLPTARSAAGAVALGGRIWIGGGEIPGVFDEHEVYDPGLDDWQPAPALPLARHGTQPAVIDGIILWPGGGLVAGFLPTEIVDAFRPELVFADGFELGDTSLWEMVVGGRGP